MPLHPRRDRPTLIPRLSYGQQSLKPLLAEQGARCAAASLYYIQTNPELAFLPPATRLGLVLDPMTYIREKPLAARASAFRASSWGATAEAFDPDRSPISDKELEDLGTAPIDLQRGRGATLMLTSYHVAGACGTRGRDLDLLLARTGIAHFQSERMDEPPEHAAIDVDREIYATIVVPIEDVCTPSARHRLASAYMDLGADGLWVKLLGFNETASLEHIKAGAAFLRELAEGPLPVVSDGAGQLHLGLLACEVSASIGIGESERFRYPSAWKQATAKSKSKGRTRSAYHPTFMRSFKIGSDSARKAFAASRCRCGEHPPAEPPGNAQVGAHAAIVRMRDAADALDGDLDDRREWLLGLATKASWAEKDAELPPGKMLAAVDAFFAGWDESPAVVAASS